MQTLHNNFILKITKKKKNLTQSKLSKKYPKVIERSERERLLPLLVTDSWYVLTALPV